MSGCNSLAKAHAGRGETYDTGIFSKIANNDIDDHKLGRQSMKSLSECRDSVDSVVLTWCDDAKVIRKMRREMAKEHREIY